MTVDTHCPLCAVNDCGHFFSDRRREYLRCEVCALVFVPPEFYLDLAQERAEYDKHENNVDDPGYRTFLSRLAVPLLDGLAPASRGLDFGCGPGPALAQMLRDAGHDMAVYDSYYAPDDSVLGAAYDFICATEVVEHLHQPGNELGRLWGMLRPGGQLGVMTKLVHDREAFATWHYKNDPTHVCFFSRSTWQWWAQRQGARVRFMGSDVILLARSG
ncbi:MAG: class I SAM-dependent methyltransferase [Halioglobus sp.]